MVKLKINNIETEVEEGTTLLKAARAIGVNIPTLCYLEDINEIGACRMCLVEIKGARALQAACVYPVSEGLEVFTNTKAVREARQANLELILSDHNCECTSCVRSGSCELQTLSKELGIERVRFSGAKSSNLVEVNEAVVRDESKCIYCKRCVSICTNVQGIGALGPDGRGFEAGIRPVFGRSLSEANCISCGQCIANCPVGALYERSSIEDAQSYIDDPSILSVAVIAPAVRAAIAEEFGYPAGTDTTAQMVEAVKMLGFDKVYDVTFTADLTILEEGTELIGRIQNGGKLPMITSCSPGWINLCERFFPELLSNLSSCKSPQGMLGALLKSYFPEQFGYEADKIKVVSIMPCTAKKTEQSRPQLSRDGKRDIDCVITTRELAKMIKRAGISYQTLKGAEFDSYYGDSTGAGVIFGATGGVMEAALRTAVETITGQESEKIDYTDARGLKGVKEFEVQAGGLTLKACVVSGGANIKRVLKDVIAGKADYHFIEVMACPGGCINGGGQPIQSSLAKAQQDIRALRAGVLYNQDANVYEKRKSHENPSVLALYKDFLGEPNSHKAHELLHTHYEEKPLYAEID